MAINSPKVQINYQDKKINNSRETYFSENENLIIGKKGLTFQYYPTKKLFFLEKNSIGICANKKQYTK